MTMAPEKRNASARNCSDRLDSFDIRGFLSGVAGNLGIDPNAPFTMPVDELNSHYQALIDQTRKVRNEAKTPVEQATIDVHTRILVGISRGKTPRTMLTWLKNGGVDVSAQHVRVVVSNTQSWLNTLESGTDNTSPSVVQPRRKPSSAVRRPARPSPDNRGAASFAKEQATEAEEDQDDLVRSKKRFLQEVEGDSVRYWFKKAGQRPLLQAHEEVDLAQRMARGLEASELLRARSTGKQMLGPAQLRKRRELLRAKSDGEYAKNILIESNLRLVISYAKRRVGQGLDFLDLIQEGNAGLIKAVERFDPNKGVKFSTYATWWIRQTIGRAVADQSRTIRMPVYMHSILIKVKQAQRDLSLKNGVEPTVDQLVEETKLKPKQVYNALVHGGDAVSLDMPLSGLDDERTMIDIVADTSPGPEVMVEELLSVGGLYQAINLLPPTIRDVLLLRFGFMTNKVESLDVCGSHFQKTGEWARQQELVGLSMLRHPAFFSLVGGDDQASRSWKSQGICGTAKHRIVFVQRSESQMRAVCSQCPVKSRCREEALENKEGGLVWGGRVMTRKGTVGARNLSS